MNPIDAANAFIRKYFPDCWAAFLAGSVVRGEETPTSDLDIVIITSGDKGAPYRESFRAFGWPIEAFIHTAESYRDFFASDAKRRRPSLPMMCAEGIILRDQDGQAIRIKEEARGLIDAGPEPLSAAETNNLRYAITDILDDLLGSQRHDESLFIAYDLAVTATELILSYHRQWLGRGKWVLRAFHRYDPHLAEQLAEALRAFCETGDRDKLVQFAESALEPVGGRLFEGYAVGRRYR